MLEYYFKLKTALNDAILSTDIVYHKRNIIVISQNESIYLSFILCVNVLELGKTVMGKNNWLLKFYK